MSTCLQLYKVFGQVKVSNYPTQLVPNVLREWVQIPWVTFNLYHKDKPISGHIKAVQA